MKRSILIFIATMFSLASYAQQNTQVRGNVVDAATNEPVAGVAVAIKAQNLVEVTDAQGEFQFLNVKPGEEILSLSGTGIISRDFIINIRTDLFTLLKDIKVVLREQLDNTALFGVVEEGLLNEDMEGTSSQEISTMVILSNDVYLNATGYQLSQFRFKVRGYDPKYEEKYINGVKFNDQNRGVFSYSSIGALNDLTRNGDHILYNTAGSFAYGTIGGAENINMRASSYAPGSKLTLSYTNRNYYLRGMYTYSTGLRDDGWAFTMSVGGRYSDEGNVKGTFYRNLAYGVAVEKQFAGGRHSISFTTFGSPVERGQQSASYGEVYELTGDNLYNSYWGYQNGKKRNSRVVKNFDPTGILSHIWKIDDNTTLTSGVGVHYNRYGGTALNWYNGPDPRPDYYRYLPSYYESSPEVAQMYRERWKSGDKSLTQINWDELYYLNHLNVREGDGRAIYMVEERRSDLLEASFNSTLNTVLSEKTKLNAGVGFRWSRSFQFSTVKDLMGSSYVLDVDKFAERDFPGDDNIIQNDLNKPGRRAYRGDKFGYDFNIDIYSANVWFQNEYSTRAVDITYGAKLSYTEFQRKGKMKNGRYPENSFGKGRRHDFIDHGMKAGIVGKITGRHFLTANVSWHTEAPLPYNAYITSRISDNTIAGLESEKIFSTDINYIFSLPSISGRVSVFHTNFYDQTMRKSYYYDAQRTFVHQVFNGVNTVNRGIELGIKYKLNNNWSFDLAGTLAEYFYSNNPNSVISYENGSQADMYEKAYIKDYYVGATPQAIGTIGVNYFYNYWFVNLNINGVARNYVDIAPFKRMASNYESLNPNEPDDMAIYKALTSQERYGSAYTIDLSIGKMFYLKNRRSVNFNIALNNILNRETIKTGGYEQARIDLSNPNRFAAKYYYMQGFNCFINASYRF